MIYQCHFHSEFDGCEIAQRCMGLSVIYLEVVLHFRPVCSLVKLDQGFIQAANLIGSNFLS